MQQSASRPPSLPSPCLEQTGIGLRYKTALFNLRAGPRAAEEGGRRPGAAGIAKQAAEPKVQLRASSSCLPVILRAEHASACLGECLAGAERQCACAARRQRSHSHCTCWANVGKARGGGAQNAPGREGGEGRGPLNLAQKARRNHVGEEKSRAPGLWSCECARAVLLKPDSPPELQSPSALPPS